MPTDYFNSSEIYKPVTVKTLLITISPPLKETENFYIPRNLISSKKITSVIFNHYFGRHSDNSKVYDYFLHILKNNGIFLMNIIEEHFKIVSRAYIGGVIPEQFEKFLTYIPFLRPKIISRGIKIPDEQIIFLIPNNKFKRPIKRYFRNSQFILCNDFRHSRELLDY